MATPSQLKPLADPKCPLCQGNGFTTSHFSACSCIRQKYGVDIERVIEQHQAVEPELIDYISLRLKDKAEKTYELLGHLTDEGDALYKTGSNWIELRLCPFDTAKEARQFAKDYYPQLEVQRD